MVFFYQKKEKFFLQFYDNFKFPDWFGTLPVKTLKLHNIELVSSKCEFCLGNVKLYIAIWLIKIPVVC